MPLLGAFDEPADEYTQAEWIDSNEPAWLDETETETEEPMSYDCKTDAERAAFAQAAHDRAFARAIAKLDADLAATAGMTRKQKWAYEAQKRSAK